MAEPAVTVVHCDQCSRSDDLSLLDGRFWCGWCQRWTAVTTERVGGAAVIREGDVARLAPPGRVGLQPLRIPNGWQIEWNTLFEEDPTEPANANGYYLGGTDLFFATRDRARRAIDIEWRTEIDQPAVGRYRLRVLPLVAPTEEQRQRLKCGPLIADWEAPVHEFETPSRVVLVAELEACLRGERG